MGTLHILGLGTIPRHLSKDTAIPKSTQPGHQVWVQRASAAGGHKQVLYWWLKHDAAVPALAAAMETVHIQ